MAGIGPGGFQVGPGGGQVGPLSGGGDVLLAGTSAGTSSTSAQLALSVSLSGTAAGVAATSGALDTQPALSGTSAGTSTTSGTLTNSVLLTGSSDGVATTSGSLDVIHVVDLVGSSAGSASTAAAISVAIALAGSSAGVSTATGSLSGVVQLAGSSAGQATATGSLTGGQLAFTVSLDGINIGATPAIALSADALAAMEAAAPASPIVIPMAARFPVFVRSQPVSTTMALTGFLLERTYQQRRTTYANLEAALRASDGLVPLTWSAGDGVVKEVQVFIQTVTPDAFYQRFAIEILVPDPEPIALAS